MTAVWMRLIHDLSHYTRQQWFMTSLILMNETDSWPPLQTHCNTLQHTATHCNTLQHTATHCNRDWFMTSLINERVRSLMSLPLMCECASGAVAHSNECAVIDVCASNEGHYSHTHQWPQCEWASNDLITRSRSINDRSVSEQVWPHYSLSLNQWPQCEWAITCSLTLRSAVWVSE